MAEFSLRIEKMHCGSCVKRVSQALAGAEGLTVEEVRIGAARVIGNEGAGAAAVEALAKAGYPALVEE